MSDKFNIASNSLSVFPLSKNRTGDRSARLFYENNVANIIRQLIDVEGFLISDSFSLDVGNALSDSGIVTYPILLKDTLVFNLYGYYFCINKGAQICRVSFDQNNIDSVTYTLYAAIEIDTVANEIKYFDNNSVYEGLQILMLGTDETVEKPSETADYHFIELCTFTMSYNKVNADNEPERWEWVVNTDICDASYQKISVKSLDMSISRIDGKH